MIALDLISRITATVEPISTAFEDRMREYGLYPKRATIRNGVIIEYRGTVNLSRKELTKIPFRFVRVTGSFWCDDNSLTSLAGCPKDVGGNFNCSRNHLTSLAGCPKYVGGDFYCHHNPGSASFTKPSGIKGDFCAY